MATTRAGTAICSSTSLPRSCSLVMGLQRGWLRRITGKPYRARVIHSRPIGGRLGLEKGNPDLHAVNLEAALSYVLKGASEAAAAQFGLGHRLISSHPDSGGGEFDEGEVVGVVLFVAGGDGPEVLELVEEALDEVAVAIEEGAEGRDVGATGSGLTLAQAPRSARSSRSASLS